MFHRYIWSQRDADSNWSCWTSKQRCACMIWEAKTQNVGLHDFWMFQWIFCRKTISKLNKRKWPVRVCVGMIHELPQADRIFALILREPRLNCCAQSAALKELCCCLLCSVCLVWRLFPQTPTPLLPLRLTVSHCVISFVWHTHSVTERLN